MNLFATGSSPRPFAQRLPLALSLLLVLVGCGLVAVGCAGDTRADVKTAAERDLAFTSPEDQGFSSERLARLNGAMQQLVDEGKLAGIETMLARHGKIVHHETFGMRDIEAGDAMPKNAVFRIYSMTKPITGVALMMLYEEGLFRLSDPVEKFIPELADLKVAAGEGADGPILEDADHPMTIRELMSHTAGLTYGIFSRSQVDSMYVDAGILNPESTLREMVEALGEIPLRQQPGTQWHYSVAVDVQGYLVEVLSGMPFDQFLQEKIFDPLEMVDTGFYVREENHGRFAQVYNYEEDGSLVAREGFAGGQNFLEPVKFHSGGGGLVSTISDYMRFCQMLANGGELDGVRILSPLTIELMHRNQLPREVGEMSPGVGFGLDFAVALDPVAADTISKGEYWWGGAAGTWFWIDPKEDLIFVGMIQQFGQGRPDVRSLSRRLVYQALLEPAGS